MRRIDEGLEEIRLAEEEAESVKAEYGGLSVEYRDACKKADEIRRQYLTRSGGDDE